MRYHHIGIPNDEVRDSERHLAALGMYVSGWELSPFGVEWMRFEPDSPLPELVRTLAHVAFEVDDLDAALEGREVIIEPTSPSEGILVAFIVHDGPQSSSSRSVTKMRPDVPGAGQVSPGTAVA